MGKVKIKHSQHPYDCIFGKTHIIWSIYQHTNLAITLKKQNRYNNKNNKKLKSEKNYLKLVFCNSYQLKFPINVPFRVDFQPSEVSQLESWPWLFSGLRISSGNFFVAKSRLVKYHTTCVCGSTEPRSSPNSKISQQILEMVLWVINRPPYTFL